VDGVAPPQAADRARGFEVKSGAGGSLRSLHLLLATYPSCPEGIVLCSGPFAHRPEQRLTFMPLYAAGSLGDPPP